MAREFAPEVVLLDIGLPEMDGIAVAEAVRREGLRTRLIGLSAHAGPEEEARARAAGMDDFLSKPVRLGRLGATIAAHVGRGRHGDDVNSFSEEPLRARLWDHFARETPTVLAELHSAKQVSDWDRLRRAAHYLKNSADVLGLTELQKACAAVAQISEADATDDAGRLIEEIEAAVPRDIAV